MVALETANNVTPDGLPTAAPALAVYVKLLRLGVDLITNGPVAIAAFVPEATVVCIGQPGINPWGLVNVRVITLGSAPFDAADATGIEAFA